MYRFRKSSRLYTASDLSRDIRLPSFVCIGAPKCATTWLFSCLQEHPGVFVPDFKEVNFFTVSRWGDDYESKGVEYYASFFVGAGADRVVGDFSPNLLQDPFAPERVKALLPDVRLIVMMRNPIVRAHSHYHFVRNRAFQRQHSLREVLDDPSIDHSGYLSQGLYGEQLERWWKHFAADRFLVITTDEVQEAPREVFRRTCNFIGADVRFEPACLRQRVNAAKTVRFPLLRRWNMRVSRFLTEHNLDGARTGIKRAGVPGLLRSLNEKPIENPPLSPREARDLADFYREDVKHLSRLLGRDFSSWLQGRDHDSR